VLPAGRDGHGKATMTSAIAASLNAEKVRPSQ
jgi:hypothetical protein